MGYHECTQAHARHQAQEQLEQTPGTVRVERGGRLVGQQQQRFMGNRPNAGNALAFANRQGLRLFIQQPLQAQHVNGMVDVIALHRHPEQTARQADVVAHAQERQQAAALQNESKMP